MPAPPPSKSTIRTDERQERHVGRREIEPRQVASSDPTGIAHFERAGDSAEITAPVAEQKDMKAFPARRPIDVGRNADQSAHFNVEVEFLLDLAPKAVLQGFARLHLPARELPSEGFMNRIRSPLRDEDLSFAFDHGRGHGDRSPHAHPEPFGIATGNRHGASQREKTRVMPA